MKKDKETSDNDEIDRAAGNPLQMDINNSGIQERVAASGGETPNVGSDSEDV